MTRFSPSVRRLLENMFSNYAYVALMALITLFVVPLYLRVLGSAVWAEVALCLTLQGFLFSLDLAIGPLMLRDVARAAASGYAASAYLRFLMIYGRAAIALCLLGLVLSILIAYSREMSGQPLSADLLWAMRLALLQFLFQFSNNAAIGYWNGCEQQRFANLRLAGFALAKHMLALFLLVAWSASAVAYMSAFVVLGALEFATNHRLVRRAQADMSVRMNIAIDSSNWRDAAGFGVAALLGFATAQIDRGYLSLALPAQAYGIYFLISAPMLSLFSLQMPIQRAFLPRLATATSPRSVAAAMLKFSALLLVLPSLALAAFPELALRLWLHNPAIAIQGADTFRLLMFAVALNAIFSPAGMLLLNLHRNTTIGAMNAAILIVQGVILAILTPRLGMTAGAVAWLACGLIQLLCAVMIWHVFGRVDKTETLDQI